jgi:hypothetical protein
MLNLHEYCFRKDWKRIVHLTHSICVRHYSMQKLHHFPNLKDLSPVNSKDDLT